MSLPSVMQLRQLVGNPQAYSVQQADGKYFPVRRPLTPVVLLEHLHGDVTVGTYLVKDGDQAKTLVLDFDSGDKAELEAFAAVKALVELGIPERSYGVEFSGNKGYHVWVVCATYVPANWLRRIGTAALTLVGVTAEVYPKQDSVKDLGNLVKLPGGVHRVSGKRAEFVTPFPQPCSAVVLKRVVGTLPDEPQVRGGEAPAALDCMHHIQQGVGEGGRNIAMYHFATMLRRAGLNETYVSEVVHAVNQEFDPPMDDDEVVAVVESSRHGGPICSQLPDELRCAECPVLRDKGLYKKEGQLRHGANGELAVIEIRKHERDMVYLDHPDIKPGSAVLLNGGK